MVFVVLVTHLGQERVKRWISMPEIAIFKLSGNQNWSM